MTGITEAVAEEAALDWLSDLGRQTAYGPDIAPESGGAERDDYGQVVLERRLRDALASLNPNRPPDAIESAFRKLTRPEGSTLAARNRTFHQSLVCGVGVEFPTAEGAIRGRRRRSSTSTGPRPTTGSRSTSSRSPRTSTRTAPTSSCS